MQERRGEDATLRAERRLTMTLKLTQMIIWELGDRPRSPCLKRPLQVLLERAGARVPRGGAYTTCLGDLSVLTAPRRGASRYPEVSIGAVGVPRHEVGGQMHQKFRGEK